MSGSIEIKGLGEALKKLSPELLNMPLYRFLDKSAMHIQTEAMRKAPVDTGRLRRSIVTQLDDASPPMWAKIGTNVKYAPWMEFGTGLVTDGEGGKGGRHWPPAAPLDTWAQRHGFEDGAAVADKIGKRGGLKPRRFLRGALQDGLPRIRQFVKELAAEIGAAWGS